MFLYYYFFPSFLFYQHTCDYMFLSPEKLSKCLQSSDCSLVCWRLKNLGFHFSCVLCYLLYYYPQIIHYQHFVWNRKVMALTLKTLWIFNWIDLKPPPHMDTLGYYFPVFCIIVDSIYPSTFWSYMRRTIEIFIA